MADVKTINGYNINDDVGRTNIGCTEDTYNSGLTYAVGDVVVYENKIYKCITAVTTAEAFNSSKWQQICLRDLLIETRKVANNANNKVVNSKSIDNKNENTYSANIIDGLVKETYSTEETFTGKYWIDGKPIYRKVVTITLEQDSYENQNFNHNIANIDFVTNYITNTKRPSGQYMVGNIYESSEYRLAFKVSNTSITVQSWWPNIKGSIVYVTMEYTKK